MRREGKSGARSAGRWTARSNEDVQDARGGWSCPEQRSYKKLRDDVQGYLGDTWAQGYVARRRERWKRKKERDKESQQK